MKILTATPEAVRLLHEGALTLAQVSANGIRIDVEYLDITIREVTIQIQELQSDLEKDAVWKKWKKQFGSNANMGSREQLGVILYDVLKYLCTKRTEPSSKYPNGKPSVDEETLALINLPFVRSYLRVEKLKKMMATYLQGYKQETVDGFLHPSFNLHTVETYRSSGSQPNVQNVPVRDPVIGKMLRKCFIPREGRVLVEIDYGALEFRIAACFWKDPGMISYASDPKLDIHRDQAAECYALEKWQVSKNSRYCAKNKFVFPIIYGSYYVQCAKNLWEALDSLNLRVVNKDDTDKNGSGVSIKEHLASQGIESLGRCDPKKAPLPGTFEGHIKEVEDTFNARFPNFGEGKDRWYKAYRKNMAFQLMTGFVIKGLFSRNFLMNAPIQGPGFHCLLWSMIRIQEWIRKVKFRTKIVAEIHDCIVLDVPVRELQDVLYNCKRIMTEEILKVWKWIVVPLEVEVDVVPVGESWDRKSPWVEKGGTWQAK